ncbi:hypothetical protein [Saccharicrinis aurantiacus]|uniref:hypothetical protein n=1 Tax=Saccharicrinis aurantiacus TaxID=1849719 RepID=UPI002490F518|nr:hypothetical protein [Saccharicrinis aurantiacus]
MNRLLRISFLTSLCIALTLNAQVPNSFTYQAVIRMADGSILSSSSIIKVQISIINTSEFGEEVYVEDHLTSSNKNGLITLAIGEGNILVGDFSLINWTDGPYFVKTEIDPYGGEDYILSSTTQLLTVPYAMHAKSAELVEFNNVIGMPESITGNYSDLIEKPNIKDSITIYTSNLVPIPEGTSDGDLLYWDNNKWNTLAMGLDGQVLSSVRGKLVWKDPVASSPTEGSLYEKGDVFYEYGVPIGVVIESSQVGQYAKILSLYEYTVAWDINGHVELTNADNANNGILNMNVIKNSSNVISSYPAFSVCEELGNGWYLPALNELLTITDNREELSLKLAETNGATSLNGKLYWTSTEAQQTLALVTVLSDTTITMTEEFFNVFELDFSHLFDENGTIPIDLNPMGSDSLFVAGSSFKARKYQPLKVRPIRYLSWAEMNSKPVSKIEYKIGDVYPSIDNAEGVVIEIWNSGLNGKIIAANQDSLAWSLESSLNNATSLSDGSINKAALKSYDITLTTFPAFRWCIDKGEKWYLPARTELISIYNNIEKINNGLMSLSGAIELKTGATTDDVLYWSSSEINDTKAFIINFKESGVEYGDSIKTNKALVRSIRTF